MVWVLQYSQTRTFPSNVLLLADDHRLQRYMAFLSPRTANQNCLCSPTGSWWNRRSRATALIAGFSSVTLR